MYMLHRITRSADVPVATHPDEALDKSSFRIGNAGAVGPKWTTASSASGSDHRGNTLSNAETTPKPVPTRLETFLNLLNRSTKESVPLTIDIPSSSPMRPASVPSTPTPIYDWFAQTASQEDQHGSTNREPTSFLDERRAQWSLEEHGIHPTPPTSVHDEASDSVSNYSTDLESKFVASTTSQATTPSKSTSTRFERNSESNLKMKQNNEGLAHPTDHHCDSPNYQWDARSLVLLRVLLRTGRCQVDSSRQELRNAQEAIDRVVGIRNRSSGDALFLLFFQLVGIDEPLVPWLALVFGSSSAASFDTDGTSPDSSPRLLKSPIPTTSQSRPNGHHKRTSVQSLPAGRGNGSFVDTAAPAVPARDGPGSSRRASAPPNPLKSVSLAPRRGRPMLEPRGPKIQFQFFGLDLSFLEDEPPPPPPGSSSVRPSWAVARCASSGASGRSPSDEFGSTHRPSITSPTQRASVGSIGLTCPSASRPFPPRKPPPLSDSDLRRASSSNKKTSPSAVSLNAFGRLGPATSPLSPSRTASSSSESEDERLPLSNSHLSTVEQRANLAAYLDETAEAMEGGKSLAMAHEELRTSNGSRRPSRDFQAAFEAQEAQKAAEQQSRRAEKRRRTIKELCDTERVYASDLAVLRDIFLTRARGAVMSSIADHVMASGLGLVRLGKDEEESPSFNATWAPTPRSGQTSFTRSSVLAKLERRRQDSTVQALEYVEDAVMSSRDIYTIFINLEEIAQLAERFSASLDAAQGIDSEDAQDDRIGEVFVDMLPRIKQVYSTYCARHHRAIIRLQELEPTLRTYFSKCRALSQGRTSAWDLASLLIKPVQRCLKYPLLLEQILAVTPLDHPDRPSLVAALKLMLLTAEHINDYKKRTDKVENVLASKRGSHSHSRDTSFSLHKKLLRSAAKSKPTGNITDQNGLFDTLAALVDTTRAGVLRFSAEMKDWSRMTRGALEAQVTMVSGWIDLYAPIGDEMYPHPSQRRLEVFLDDVLVPLIEGPFRELDHEIRRSLVSKTDHLLSLFENPLQVIKRRNEHKAEHRRYMTRKMPQDQRGSEDFVTLTTQLLEELPKFLASVSKYFNIVVSAFTNVQHIYQNSVRERWEAYADEWLSQIPKGDYAAIEAAFQDASRDVTQMLASIVKGLNLSVATAGTIQGRSKSTRRNQGRDSLHSTSSSSCNTTPVMSARGRFNGAEETNHFENYSISSSLQRRSSGHGDNGSMTSSPSTGRPCLRRHEASSSLRWNKRASEALPPSPPMSTTSSSLISNYFDNVSEDEDHDGQDGDSMHHILYRAEAIASACSSAYRSGYPLLSFIEGDQVDVELEEADSEQGGSGWLLARDGQGILGWCRTEDFIVVE